jgi:hypothetical protein
MKSVTQTPPENGGRSGRFLPKCNVLNRFEIRRTFRGRPDDTAEAAVARMGTEVLKRSAANIISQATGEVAAP